MERAEEARNEFQNNKVIDLLSYHVEAANGFLRSCLHNSDENKELLRQKLDIRQMIDEIVVL